MSAAGDEPFWTPYRLVSLWEIMEQFNAGTLSGALGALNGFRQLLTSVKASPPDKAPITFLMDAKPGARLMQDVEALVEELERLGLDMSVVTARHLLRVLKQPSDVDVQAEASGRDYIGFSQERILEAKQLVERVCFMVPTDLGTRIAFAIPFKTQDYVLAEKLFGAEVDTKFSTASRDIAEAGKCFALRRHTASVFHLMRVMEIGIKAVARCLGIDDPTKPAERNWGFILKEIKAGMDAKWPAAADRMSGDGAFFESVHASLDAVKNPWRNATMHVEQNYDEEDAEHIFSAVKGFMRKLASRCDEDGKPHA